MIAAEGVDICEYIAVSITEGSNYLKIFIEKIPKYRLLDEIYNFITFKELGTEVEIVVHVIYTVWMYRTSMFFIIRCSILLIEPKESTKRSTPDAVPGDYAKLELKINHKS